MSADWPRVPLGEVLTQREPDVEVAPDQQYSFAGVYCFGRGAFVGQTKVGREFAYPRLTRLRAGDFVYPKLMAWEGAYALVPRECDGLVVSTEYPVFAINTNRLIPTFLESYFKRASVWPEFGGVSTGTNVRRRRLNPVDFLSYRFPLPPLAEQGRIVARVEAVTGKITEARQLREETSPMAQVVRSSWLNQLFETARNSSWPEAALGNVADIRSGVTLGRTLLGNTISVPYLRVANVQDGRLDLATIKQVTVLPNEVEKWVLKPGDLLITEGGDWDKLGRGTVWRGEVPTCIHQNHIFRIRSSPEMFVPEFLSAIFASPYGKSYFQSASKQTTNLASINQRQLRAFRVFTPPLPEQQRIVAHLDALQAKTDVLRALQTETAAELDALLPAVLAKAFAGEL